MPPRLVPELSVDDLEASLKLYVGVLGFEVAYARPEECFAYLERGDVHLMLEEATGPGRRFGTAALEHPYGRGINLQIEIDDVDALYQSILRANVSIAIPLEEKWYRTSQSEMGNKQFVLADRDGYLLRFFTSLGERTTGDCPPRLPMTQA